MELYKDILIKLLAGSHIEVSFKDVSFDMTEVVEAVSYQALKRIKDIVEDDSLTDKECFMQIEEIVHTYEIIGSHGGSRHDF